LDETSPLNASYTAERDSQAADHATGSIRPALLFLDALDDHVVLRRVRREILFAQTCTALLDVLTIVETLVPFFTAGSNCRQNLRSTLVTLREPMRPHVLSAELLG
jgi:hypothetical protein